MPISADEWEIGTTANDAASDLTSPVGEFETEADLVLAFLSENADNAYTRVEIVRGVDFGDDAEPETVTDLLTEIQDELVDLAGDLVASGIVVDDVDAALDHLVEEGTVVSKEIDEGDGTKTYYRLNTAETDW